MESLSQQAKLIQHAADIIEDQAIELHDAFSMPDGSYFSKNRDIEAEINDMNKTVIKLNSLVRDMAVPH